MLSRYFVLFVIICSVILLLRKTKATCGNPRYRPNLSPGNKGSNRIVRGSNAKPHSHPWQALIYVNVSGQEIYCGGSLIHWTGQNSSDLVLTAAHCVVDMSQFNNSNTLMKVLSYRWNRLFKKDKQVGIPVVSPKDIVVYLGVHNMARQESTREKLAVTDIIIRKFHQFSQDDDIAILKLDRKVEYNDYIQGICLPSEKEGAQPRASRCFATGWGDLGTGNGPDELQQIEVLMYDGYVDNPEYVKKNMLCSWKDDNEGVAEGDSGGPLACLKDNKFVLYGITSFSIDVLSSCRVQELAVFTRVTKYLTWLKENLGRPK